MRSHHVYCLITSMAKIVKTIKWVGLMIAVGLLENLSLVEIPPSIVLALPLPVLLNHLLAFVGLAIQLLPPADGIKIKKPTSNDKKFI